MRLFNQKKKAPPAEKILETQDSWTVAYLRLKGFSVPVVRRNPQSGAAWFGVQDTPEVHQKMAEFSEGEVRVVMPLFRKTLKQIMAEVKNGRE